MNAVFLGELWIWSRSRSYSEIGARSGSRSQYFSVSKIYKSASGSRSDRNSSHKSRGGKRQFKGSVSRPKEGV